MNKLHNILRPIVVLIDAENVLMPDIIGGLIAKLGLKGSVGLMRVYGHQAALDKWKAVAKSFGIHPMLQLNPGDKSNSTDFAMTIDAMDLLHSGRFGGFCLVTSDADFVLLARRIRDEGLPVYNCGEADKTKVSKKAYTDFISIESVMPKPSRTNKPANNKSPLKKSIKTIATKKSKPANQVLDRVAKVIADAGGKTEKISVVSLGQRLKKEFPEFDIKNFPHASLSKFLVAYPSHFKVLEGGYVKSG